MTPIQHAFLKEGWIQIGGADIPVFFRYEAEDKEYPFHVIFTLDDHAYYRLYNEWVEKGLLPADKIDPIPLVSAAYEHLRTTPAMFHIGVMQWLSDFYFQKARFTRLDTQPDERMKFFRESESYQAVYKHLKMMKKEKEEKQDLLKDIIQKTFTNANGTSLPSEIRDLPVGN